MPAKDIYHDVVKKALIKDGWTITHDPYILKWGSKDMYILRRLFCNGYPKYLPSNY
jgi:hypothetical protein